MAIAWSALFATTTEYPGFFEFFRDEFPDQGLIFDNQDCRHFHPSGGHFQATTAWIKHVAEQSFLFDASQ